MTIPNVSGLSINMSLRALSSYIGQKREFIPTLWYLPDEDGNPSVHALLVECMTFNRVPPELHMKLYMLGGWDLVSTVLINDLLSRTSHTSITSFCPSCG